MFGSIVGNLAGTVYFLYFQIAGLLLALMLLKKEAAAVRLVLGSVLGSVLLHWLPVLFAFFFDFGFAAHLCAAVVLLPVVICFALPYVKGGKGKEEEGGEEKDPGGLHNFLFELRDTLRRHYAFGIFFGLLLVLWCYLLYNHSIRYDVSDGAIYTGQCGYGDMNMHLGFITSIAVQKTFPPDYSIFPGVKLAYPFLSDSISSTVYLFGSSLRWAYNLPMLFAFMQIVCSFYMIAYTYLRSIRRSVLAAVFFFLNGGLGFWYFINWSYEGKYHFSDIFTGFYTTPTNLIDENIRWVNIIADMLLPQRATLFGYAILFPAIYLLYRAVFQRQGRCFYLAAVFGGALPLIHTHSFLSFGLVAASFLLMQMYRGLMAEGKKGPKGWKLALPFACFMILIQILVKTGMMQESRLMPLAIGSFVLLVLYGIFILVRFIKKYGYRKMLATWGVFLLAVAVFALPQLLGFTFGQVSEGGFVRGCFNWGNQGDFYLWFYVKNMGIVFLLGVAALCGASTRTFLFSFPLWPIWFLAEMIAFAPNNYDNNKLLYVAYLFLCIIAADYAFTLYERMCEVKGIKVLVGFGLFASVFSGILSLGREAYSELQLYGTDQVEMAKWIEENTAADAVFLTSDRHNNIIPSMTGRNIVCGSGAFLYFHGINTSERNADVKEMFEHPGETAALFRKYNVSYICYSPYEWGSYETDMQEYDRLFELVFEYENTRVYRTK